MVEAMVAEMNARHGRRVTGVTAEAMDAMRRYVWPGNARELRNMMERAVILATDGGAIEAKHLSLDERSGKVEERNDSKAEARGDSLQLEVGTTVAEAERRLILKTLESAGGNKTRAAQILAVSLKTLHNKLKEYRQKDGEQ